MIVPTYENTAKEQEIIISRLKKENKELKDKIYELEHPKEQLLKAEGLLKDLYDLVCERDTYKAKLNMVKDLVMNSDKYSDGDFEGCVFQNDILDIIRGDINDK